VRKQFLDRRSVAQFDGIFRLPHDFLEAAEEKHLYAHCL
jgi:hypothetical protein